MSDETELETRLRAAGNNTRPGFKNICQPICLEAADAIQRIRTERDRLSQTVKFYADEALIALADAGICTPEIGFLKDGGAGFMARLIGDLAAERDRFREVNKRLLDSCHKAKASLRFYDTHTSLLAIDEIDAAIVFAKENVLCGRPLHR